MVTAPQVGDAQGVHFAFELDGSAGELSGT